jgi:hypothetical protein
MAMSGPPEAISNELDHYAAGHYPDVGPTLWTGGAKYSVADFTPEEQAIFYRDFARLVSMYTTAQEISELLQNDIDRFMLAAQIAKASIGTNPNFNGVSASGNEVGMQLIRAVTIFANSGAEVLLWQQNFVGAGWNNYFGSSTTPVDLSTTGVAGLPATNLQNRTLVAFGGLIDPVSSPRLAEYRFHVGPKDYSVQSIAWMPAGNLYFARLAGFVIVPVNGKFYMRGLIEPSAGIDAAQAFGLTFGTGDYLSNET